MDSMFNEPRSEAFYDACEMFPNNRQVRATKAGGLRNCRIFSERTPADVLTLLNLNFWNTDYIIIYYIIYIYIYVEYIVFIFHKIYFEVHEVRVRTADRQTDDLPRLPWP